MSRRVLLGGTMAAAAAAAAGGGAATAAAGTIAAEPRTVRRARTLAVTPDGRLVVVAHEQRRTVAVGRRLLDVGGQPVDVAVSPDGTLAAVTTASWDGPGVTLLDLRRRRVLGRADDVGPAPHGVAFARGGERVLVAGGEQEGATTVLAARSLRVLAQAPSGICPRALAAHPTRAVAYVALQGAEAVAELDVRSGRVRRRLGVPPHPDRIALSPDGRRLLVTHAGREGDRVTELDLRTGEVRRHRAGRHPSAVAWTRDGRRLVALGGAGEVVTLGPRRRRRRVGGAPRGLAVAGRRAWTADGLTGEVLEVRP